MKRFAAGMALVACLSSLLFAETPEISPPLNEELENTPLWGEAPHKKPNCVKGIHLTSWTTGSKKARKKFESLFAETELNTAVIDIKEINGEVYLPGVLIDNEAEVYVRAIRDLEAYLNYLKDRGIFTIARITVFQDQVLPKVRPKWAVKSSSALPKAVENGFEENIWVDWRGFAWADPYNKKVWDYNIDVAVKAAELGFQGIQFDYLRFPSDGETKLCRFSKRHSAKAAAKALAGFLKKAHKRLKPFNVELSIDVFGLAATQKGGLGIGQDLSEILNHIDVLSPMMYPSHYGPGSYGLKDPNRSPYETIQNSVKDTLKVLEDKSVTLRPFFQDFSLGVKYTEKMVRAQIQAAMDQGVGEWLLWNPGCRYTRGALLPRDISN